MALKIQDFIDIEQFQMLQDRLNEIYSFPSAIIDNDGRILTATAWQDVCTQFHRRNSECEKECIKSDRYILDHLHEANPAVSYRCPHGLIDNATPIIIEGVHYGNFFTGQFFLESPDLDFFSARAKRYGFDEDAYIEAVKKVPIWSREQLDSYLYFIKGLIEVISGIGLKNLREIETRQRMQESEERHRAILQTAMDGFMRVDLQGKVLEVNDTYCRMSGYSEQELLAMRISDLDAAETENDAIAHIERIIARGEDRFETRHRRKDGSLFDVESSVQYRPADGRQIIAFLRDITEHKRAEDALRKSEEQYRNVFENHAAVKLLIDPDTGNILEANKAAADYYGWSYDQLRQMRIQEINTQPPEDVKKGMDEVRNKGRIHFEFRHRRADGSIRDVDVFSSRIQAKGKDVLHSIIHDITDRKRVEETLQQERTNAVKMAEEIEIIAEIGKLISSTLDTDDVYEKFASEVKKLIPFDRIVMSLVNRGDRDRRTIAYVSGIDVSGRRPGDSVPLAGSINEEVIDTRKGVIVGSIPGDDLIASFPSVASATLAGIRSHMCVPMLNRDAVVGTLMLQSTKPDAYTEYDLVKAQRIGVQIAGAIANNQLYNELKKAEISLRDSEERYRTLFTRASDGIFIMSLDGNLVEVSESFARMHGYGTQEMLGMNLKDFDTPETSRWAPERMRRILAGETLTFEVEHYHRDGRAFPLEVSASLISYGGRSYVQCFHRDISDRKRTEEALKASNELFSLFMHHSPIYAFIKEVTPTRSLVLQASDNYRQMIGIPGRDMVGKTMSELFPPEFAARMTADDWAVVCQGRMLTVNEEFNGRSYTTIKFPILREDKNLLAGYSIDVTEQKLANEEKDRLQRQLFQAQKMESVGRLAGGVAHDFNNMLAVILGHVELAGEQVDPTQPLYSSLQEIRNAAERSADLTRQLLAFARKQTISPRVLDMNDTVSGMLKMLQRLIGEDIHLAWLPGANLWPIRIDPSQIDQILANLCVNARDAIDGVGKVTIETENITVDDAYCADHPGFSPGDYVMLAVSDDGCGMDKEILGKLFEPFFTTKGVGKGTGLGLAMCYGIVKQNNGFINVYSEPDRGTTFKIYLPRQIGRDEQTRQGVQKQPIGGRETILVVEDEPTLLELSQLMLEQLGYRVLTADTPSEALRLAEEHAGDIHLLITDVVMPEMNGRDVAKRMLSLYPGIKRLFMSGYTADVIAHHGILDEGVYFIQKPFSRNALAAKVREALDQV